MARPSYDVVLVQPNITWVYDPFEHLGLASLAATLRRAGFTVRIVDAVLERMSMVDLYKLVDGWDIGVLGVTLISHGYHVTVRFLERWKEHHPQVPVVAGGHFASFAAPKILAHTHVFDAIFLGEADHTFPRYCRDVLCGGSGEGPGVQLRGGKPSRFADRVTDLDVLPFVERDYLELALKRGAQASVASSRGCYARCTFCTVHNFYEDFQTPRWLGRSIPSVIAELEQLHARFGLTQFMFIDDNFMGPGKAGRERAIAFAEAYKASGLPMTFHIDCRAADVGEEVIEALVDAGLRTIFIGIESVADADLALYRKDLRPRANHEAVRIIQKYNLDYTLAMILFNPDTTLSTILENTEFLREVAYFPRNPLTILNVYEGTDLATRYRDRVRGPFWDYRFDFEDLATRLVYDEAMCYARSTLPLERELSHRRGGAAGLRREVHRLRLLALEDFAQSYPWADVDELRARWGERLTLLTQLCYHHRDDGTEGPAERCYITGSAIDEETINAASVNHELLLPGCGEE